MEPRFADTIVILGAGFSKAVFTDCPTADELGNAVRSRLSAEDQAKLPTAAFSEGRFEEWLSYLSEVQPHFKPEDTHDAAALVIRVTRAIGEVLADIQRCALLAEPPSWFFELLTCLHVQRSTVISLNYDNLVECGVRTIRLKGRGWFGTDEVYEDDILGGLPPRADFPERVNQDAAFPWSPGASSLVAERRSETFSLLKLHGSLSWYWLPQGSGSSTLRRWQLPGTFGELWDPAEELRRQELPSHEVFIVPPAVLKGQRLQEPVARELWRRASEALSGAQRVVLIGYSIPLADHSVSGMLADALAGREVQLEVVDLQPGPVWQRLSRLGVSLVNAKEAAGDDALGRWTAAEVGRLARNAAMSLKADRDLTGEELIFVDNPREERILRVESSDGGVTLRLVLNPAGQQLTRPIQYKDIHNVVTTAQTIVVDVDGRALPVIDFWKRPEGSGGLMAQLHLVLAGT